MDTLDKKYKVLEYLLYDWLLNLMRGNTIYDMTANIVFNHTNHN
jgi:hypothetical protein